MKHYSWPYFKDEDEIRRTMDQRIRHFPIPNGIELGLRSAAIVAANVLIVMGMNSQFDREAAIAFVLFEGLIVFGLDVIRMIVHFVESTLGRTKAAGPTTKVFFEMIFLGLGALVICWWQSNGAMGFFDDARNGFHYLFAQAKLILIPLGLVTAYHLHFLITEWWAQTGRQEVSLRGNGGGWIFLFLITCILILINEEGEISTLILIYVLLGLKVFGQAVVTWSLPLGVLIGEDADKKKKE